MHVPYIYIIDRSFKYRTRCRRLGSAIYSYRARSNLTRAGCNYIANYRRAEWSLAGQSITNFRSHAHTFINEYFIPHPPNPNRHVVTSSIHIEGLHLCRLILTIRYGSVAHACCFGISALYCTYILDRLQIHMKSTYAKTIDVEKLPAASVYIVSPRPVNKSPAAYRAYRS